MAKNKKRILVVGAGFAGATVARELADAGGYEVHVIDKRPHVAGNAFDAVHAKTGNRYHVYGPHIFHTNDKLVFHYLSRFTEWLPYKHRVRGFVPGVGDVPIPVNIETMNKLYKRNIASEAELKVFLSEVRVPIPNPKNAHEHLINIYGEKLTDLFFERYTKKMWGMSLKETPVSTVARIPVRTDNNPYYFNDTYQCMPNHGYTRLIENMLDASCITVSLGTGFDKALEKEYDHIFNSMPIDEYFDFCFGELPYRSIKFEHRIGEKFEHSVPTVNFTDESSYTRKTNWAQYPGCGGGEDSLITYELPCDYKDNDFERYYPVKTIGGEPQEKYRQYRTMAKSTPGITFIGRCGQYIYYDMHQVVASTRKTTCEYIKAGL